MTEPSGVRLCSAPGCDLPVKAVDWCLPHYRRWYRTGDPLPQPKQQPPPCAVGDCDTPVAVKGYCLRHYRQWRRTGDPVARGLSRRDPGALCEVEGCEDPAGTRNLCRKHYAKLLRRGDPLAPPQRRPPGAGTLASNGRLVTHAPGHPLASRGGDVYVHRKTLFDTIGWGPHYCYWCPRLIGWAQAPGPDGVLNVVQLDGDYTNVAVSNLVPACNECTQHKSRDGLRRKSQITDDARETSDV